MRILTGEVFLLSCSCHSLQEVELDVDGWLVRARSVHVARHIALQLGSAAEANTWFVAVERGAALVELCEALPRSDRAEVQVMPVRGGGVAAWDVRSLEVWAGRIASPWFTEAARALHFELQPILNLRTGATFGYEALVRANIADRGFAAGELLRAAEAHEQMRAFDALARTSAIETAYPRLAPEHALFINFAPGVVYNPDVCLATTFAACARVGADFSRLVFEVTESESFPDLALLRAILAKYRSHGALVALDDLGSGFTSLLYLRDLRPDLVKIDRGLIAGIHAGDPRVGLLRSLVDFAHELGVRVVVEGIETPDEFEFALRLGADFAQGYFIGRPAREVRRPTPAALALWAQTQVSVST